MNLAKVGSVLGTLWKAGKAGARAGRASFKLGKGMKPLARIKYAGRAASGGSGGELLRNAPGVYGHLFRNQGRYKVAATAAGSSLVAGTAGYKIGKRRQKMKMMRGIRENKFGPLR